VAACARCEPCDHVLGTLRKAPPQEYAETLAWLTQRLAVAGAEKARCYLEVRPILYPWVSDDLTVAVAEPMVLKELDCRVDLRTVRVCDKSRRGSDYGHY
jgi:hypothetical protein